MSTAEVREHRIEKEPLGKLLKLRVKGNPKKHDAEKIKDSIDENGFVMPVLVDDAENMLGAGHGRLQDLDRRKKAGEEPPLGIEARRDDWYVPVIRGVRFKSKRAFQKYLLADNATTIAGGWDDQALAKNLRAIGISDLKGSGFGEDDYKKLMSKIGATSGGNTHPDDVPDVPKKARSKTGDLYVLGEHRILCGDSTRANDLLRLFGDDRAALMATDPPYGIAYTKAKDGIPRSGFRDIVKRFGSIANDELSPTKLYKLLEAFLMLAVRRFAPKAGVYVWHPSGELQDVFWRSIKAAGILVHRSIIWKKPGFVLSRSGMYHPAHEDAFYGWVQGKMARWFGPKNQTSVWEVGRDDGKALHPTQKPVELFEIPMRNHTVAGDACYEPFSGSGSQIIAGERLGRRVLAIEKDARYVDVAVDRWEAFTGKRAERRRA